MNPELALDGRLTIHMAADLQTRLALALAGGMERLDLRAVDEIDTAGVQLLLACDQTLRAQGRRLQVLHPSPPVVEVLTRYAVDGLMS
ncbi:STAS domain-containing protein [Ideonella livida]|uniref:STAS domain-containing protein n=1 Tax=Ideonella livida TaxID=2707176 RepID=A0A7C9TIN7_9BURK|nr:STAS domain-containing protein [Ideonella livida]NDY91459.1 STAS domain-containing protein [Ideonella livida]